MHVLGVVPVDHFIGFHFVPFLQSSFRSLTWACRHIESLDKNIPLFSEGSPVPTHSSTQKIAKSTFEEGLLHCALLQRFKRWLKSPKQSIVLSGIQLSIKHRLCSICIRVYEEDKAWTVLCFE